MQYPATYVPDWANQSHFQILLLDDAVHHEFCESPSLPVLVGLVHAPEVLPPKADEAEHCAKGAESALRHPGTVVPVSVVPKY